ncbi:MAG: alpha/beta hydrolase [Bacteroidia bacterium]|nr:alpha/beta hydrolase [Bacteroidia bacterium]
MKSLYLLSGLGADHRVFDFLEFGDFSTKPVEWIKPGKDESIQSYARRLAEQIDDANPILIGLSFGGMMAVELAKIISASGVILLSSARDKHQLPAFNRAIAPFNLVQWLPPRLLKQPNLVLHWLFGLESKQEKKLLKDILQDTDDDFLKWGISQVPQWTNTDATPNLIQIHGKSDRVFPHRQGDYLVDDGGHFMVVNRAPVVSAMLAQALRTLTGSESGRGSL